VARAPIAGRMTKPTARTRASDDHALDERPAQVSSGLGLDRGALWSCADLADALQAVLDGSGRVKSTASERLSGVRSDHEAGSGKSVFCVIVESNTTREEAWNGDPDGSVERILAAEAAGGAGVVGAGVEPARRRDEGRSRRGGQR